MKSKIIYFVLYLVVIAELLVVIYERDVALSKLITNIQTERYLMPLVVSYTKDQAFPVSSNKTLFTVTLTANGLVTPEEMDTVQFYAEIHPDTKNLFGANYFPEKVSTLNPDDNQRIFVEKIKTEAKFNVRVVKSEIPGAVKNILTRTGEGNKAPIKYNVWFESPRILPTNLNMGAVDSIFIVIQNSDSLKLKAKSTDSIIVRYVLGLKGSDLKQLIDETGEKYLFGFRNYSQLKSEVTFGEDGSIPDEFEKKLKKGISDSYNASTNKQNTSDKVKINNRGIPVAESERVVLEFYLTR